MLTFGSLFTGIGGLDLGLERAGMRCLWQSEIEPYCCAVLKKHWPEVPNVGDITKVDPATLAPVDLICGGFPCQPVSVAGKRQAQKDKRWLWPEFARIIGALRPRYVLVENVPGLRSAAQGEAFREVLSDLARYGYDGEWAGLSAASVGAPHLRYRVFLVAYPSGAQRHAGTEESRELLEDNADRQESDHIDPPSANVADPAIFSFRKPYNEANAKPEGRQAWPLLGSGSWWLSECRLGIHPDGFSGGLDCGGWECGVSRTIKGQKNRAARLKALGNAVVPQVAEWVGRKILEYEKRRRGK